MFGPGEYRPDPSAGITTPADLPQPEIVAYSRNDLRQPCPRCGHSAYRDKQSHRTLHDLGNLDVWVVLENNNEPLRQPSPERLLPLLAFPQTGTSSVDERWAAGVLESIIASFVRPSALSGLGRYARAARYTPGSSRCGR